MICLRCSADNAAGMKFCGQCGALLGGACPSCGSSNPPEHRFCGHCGASLGPLPAPGWPPASAGVPGAPPHAGEGRVGAAATARGTLPGEMKQVTVLFCDIVNSTLLT